MTIKLKITLWYSIFMTLLAGLSLGLLLYFSASKIFNNADQQLINTVNKSIKEISPDSGVLSFDPDFHILGLEKGIYLSVYDEKGNYLYGDLPPYYNGSAYLTRDHLQEEYDFYTNWKIYDNLFTIENYGSLWIRGITSQTAKEGLLITIFRSCIILFPFFLFAISFWGYQIIKHSLAPLDQLNKIALKISSEHDLSSRIALPEKKDEVHQLAKTFDHMVEQLEQAFHREQVFTSDVSHELRTPLTVIQAECEYALLSDSTTEEKTEALETIYKQSHHMSSLTSSLLSLARMEQGKHPLVKEDFCLSKLLLMMTDSLEHAAAKKNINFHLALPETVSISADKNMMIRLFTNLLDNAISYGKENGNIWIKICFSKEEILTTIKDDGIGISSTDLPKIWDRFYQADTSRNKKLLSGSGLGLSFCKQIVQLHNGKITVESQLGKGTEFQISLPAKNKQ